MPIIIEIVEGLNLKRFTETLSECGRYFFYTHRCEDGVHSYQVEEADHADCIIHALRQMNVEYAVRD